MNGNISKRKGLVSSVDADSLNYISEKVSEKLTGYTAAVALEEAARKEADKALKSEILKKQDKLTFDTAPTAESENPLTSGVIKDELDKKVDKADGKVLSSNDFTDEDKAKLDKKADTSTEKGGFAGGLNATAKMGAAIGRNASADSGGAVGYGAKVTDTGGAVGRGASASTGGAIGYGAKVTTGGAAGEEAKSREGEKQRTKKQKADNAQPAKTVDKHNARC